MKDAKYSIFITLAIYAIVVTIWGIRLEGRVDSNIKDITIINKEIVDYRNLTLQVKNLNTTSDETLRLVGVIRDGLIAAGILKPAQ